MFMQMKTLAALSLLHGADALAAPQIWVKTSSLPLMSGGANALAPLGPQRVGYGQSYQDEHHVLCWSFQR